MACERCGSRAWAVSRESQHVEYACVTCGARRYEQRAELPPAEYVERARYNGDGALAEKVIVIRWRHEQRTDGGKNHVVARIDCPFCDEPMRRIEVSSRVRRKRKYLMRFACDADHRIDVDSYRGGYPKGTSRWRWE